MKKLLLVEDHPIFADALLLVLAQRTDLKVVKVVDTAEKALQVLPKLDLDLLLVDVSLPKMNGIDLVAQLSKLYPHMPCLLISGHMSSPYVKRGLEAGARGYALKDSAAGIIEGIYHILRGEIYISKELRALTT
jgi:DNA-binding NarL/FixJ family response regulator